MSTENMLNEKMQHRKAVRKNVNALMKGKSLRASVACYAVLEHLLAHDKRFMTTADMMNGDSALAAAMASVRDELPDYFSLDELQVQNHGDIAITGIYLTQLLQPSNATTPIGAAAFLRTAADLSDKPVAVVSDDVSFSEVLKRHTGTITHYFLNTSDERYEDRKLYLYGISDKTAGTVQKGDDFLKESDQRFAAVIICQSGGDDSAVLSKAFDLLEEGGFLLYCVSPKFLKSGDDSPFRQNCVHTRSLKTVFEVKNDRDNPIFSALMLTKEANEAVQFISVEYLIPKFDGPENGPTRTVEIAAQKLEDMMTATGNTTLAPDYYLVRKPEISTVPFGDLVQISRGTYAPSTDIERRYTSEHTSFRYLNLSGIEGTAIKGDIPYLTSIDANEEKYCVSRGDFVLSKVANPLRFAEITSDERIMTSVNLFILRPRQEALHPAYFKAWMNSRQGQQLLKSIARGDKRISVIEIRELKNLQIPCPPLDVQNAFVDELKKKEAEQRQLEERLTALRQEKDALLDSLLKGE